MDKNKNIWSEAFNNSDLGKEEWLEPSPEVLEKIKKELFSKRKRRVFYFFFLPLCLCGFSVFAYVTIYSGSGSEKEIDLREISDQLPSVISATNNSLQDHVKDSSDQGITEEFDNEKNNKLKEASSSIKLNDYNFQSVSPQIAKQSKNIEESSDLIKSKTNPQSTIKKGLEGNLSSGNKFNQDHNSSLLSDQNILKTEIKTIRASIKKVDLVIPLLLKIKYSQKRIEDNFTITVKKENLNHLYFSLGYSNAIFSLNENYKTALSLADYRQNYGHGIHSYLGYKYQLNKNFKVGVDLYGERIQAESGHNTQITYKLEEEEIGRQNNVQVTVASPLGFIESSVIIQRNIELNSNSQEVLIDLQSKHTFYNFLLLPNFEMKIADYRSLSANLNIGLGLNYIRGIQNSVNANPILFNDFSHVSSIVNQNQIAVNKFTPVASLGINLERKIRKNMVFGITYKFSNTLTPLYKNGDFSSNLIRNHIGAYIGKSF